MDEVRPGRARHAALLTPQGKILFDFLVIEAATDSFLLDVAQDKAAELAMRLLFYRLRAKVDIAEATDLRVAAVWDGAAEDAPGVLVPDPRLPALGARLIGPEDEIRRWLASGAVAATDAAQYHAYRIALGVPEGGKDYAFGDPFPHEADLDQLGGVDFDKGCFVGQEVVSRMEHRGTARRRIVPVRLDGPAPPAGTEILAGGRPLGTMGSSAGDRALAALRLDRATEALAAGEPLTAGAARVTVLKPAWARFDAPGLDDPAVA